MEDSIEISAVEYIHIVRALARVEEGNSTLTRIIAIIRRYDQMRKQFNVVYSDEK